MGENVITQANKLEGKKMEIYVKQVAIANIIRAEGLNNAEQAEQLVCNLAEIASKLSGKSVAEEWREIISFYYQAD